MTDYADLVNYIRAQTEWCSRKLSGGDWFAIDPDVAPFRAADAIERLSAQVGSLTKDREILTLDLIDRAKEIDALTKERDEARAELEPLKHNFPASQEEVKKWYGEAMRLHQLCGELAEANHACVDDNKRLRQALAPFVTITKTDGPVWYYENADDSVIVRCELTVGEIRKAREVLEGKQ